MVDVIRIKRRVTGSPGAPPSLANAELAYNEVEHVLYYGEGTGGAGGTATVIARIGGQGLSSATNPLMNGVAAPGTGAAWSRNDHVHPIDTSRAPLVSPTFTGVPAAPTAAPATNTTQIATTAFVTAAVGAVPGSPTITLTGDVTGSGTPSIATTLATVNANVGTFQGITVNAKGLVTAAVNQNYATTASLATYAPLASPALTGNPTAPTPLAGDNDTSVATTAFVTAAITAAPNQTITLTGDTTGSGAASIATTLATVNANVGTFQGITVNAKGLVTAAVDQGYATVAALNLKAPIASPTFTGIPAAPTPANGTNTTQLATTQYVLATRLDQFVVPNVDVSWNSHKITSLLDPTNAQDAATKAYVDGVVQGIDAKASVRAASTANLTLSAGQTVDGIALIAGDRALVKNQTLPAENGIYVVAAGAWARAADASTWLELQSAYVFVEQGTIGADNGYLCTVDAGGTLGTTAVTWVQFSGAGQVTAGAGLTKTGNQLDVVGTAARILVNADSVDIDAGYVGQTSITTLGTIGTGTWNATTIAVNRGGSGATTLTGYLLGNGTSPFTASPTIPNTAITGLGTMSTQNANAVAITGGTITGVTVTAASLVQVSDTPPVAPVNGQLWFDSVNSRLYMYYSDPNSSQWVGIGVG